MALLSLVFVVLRPVTAKGYVYKAFREISRFQMMWGTGGWEEVQTLRFIVRFRVQDRDIAQMVADTAEKSFEPVNRNFGYSPSDKILVIIYPTKESLGRSFGWAADESAMGVYWAGVIRVLSPAAWIEEEDPAQFATTFINEGPVAHELAHLVVDYQTGGNYTRWFTEGIAQYVEAKVTGYRVEEREINHPGDIYSFEVMDRGFDNLPDQNRAYMESLLAVEFLVEQYGEDSLGGIIYELGHDRTMETSFQNVLGLTMEEFEENFRQWLMAK